MRRHDLVVLGGGTAGLVAAFGAAGVGARAVLVERARTGGDCLWTGCVPSKSLIAAADLAQRIRDGGRLGIRPAEPKVDFGAVMAHVRRAQAAIEPRDSPERLRRAGVELIEAEGRFAGPGRIEAGGSELRYRRALVATGSRPVLPPVPGLAEAEPLTSDTIWTLERLPARLAVLGGGPLGCELAQAFARLGSAVTLVEAADRLLGREEPQAGELVAARLRAEGVHVRLGTQAEGVEPGRLLVPGAGVEFDALLVATGRRPNTEGIGLEAVGARTTPDGAVAVDDRMRTTARGVFAAGDVTGALPFTHVAAEHARIVVPNALFGARRRMSYDAVPWVTFTDPEVARVGMSEAQARERLGEIVVRRLDYGDLDRAVAAGETDGFCKLVGDRRGRIVGATIAARQAGEAIGEIAAWMRSGAGLGDLSRAVHAYPTLAEGPARAADEHLREKYLNDRVRTAARPLLAALRLLDAATAPRR